MENKYVKIWEFIKSPKFGMILAGIWLLFMIIKSCEQVNLKKNCVKQYGKCVITNIIRRTYTGASYVTYKYWIGSEEISYEFKTSADRPILDKIQVGDTLILEYCNENIKMTKNPLVDGEYLNNSLI